MNSIKIISKMMQIIAEHLQEPYRNNLFLLGDYIVIEDLGISYCPSSYEEVYVKKVGEYHFTYPVVINNNDDGSVNIESIKTNNLLIKLDQYFDEIELKLESLNRSYTFIDGKLVIFRNGNIRIHWNNSNKISKINFGFEYVSFNISKIEKDIKKSLTTYIFLEIIDYNSEHIQKAYDILYNKNKFYDIYGYRYKLYYDDDGNLNLLKILQKRKLNSKKKLTELINKLNFIKNNPYADTLPDLSIR